ncbi:MAG TPA: SGNH/GDSL hydrolase family protein [Candidatus Hydrogenedentes bacterium]|nr:SGNH/GDSL hydrolase family protein [Candidatus Hydrogenedentota bacterium]
MQVKKGQTILFIGDSITDCSRRGPCAPLGNGYVKLFADMLAIRHPSRTIQVINKGIGGDVATGLRDRWEDDVIRHRPDWLSIKIGINDLHRTLQKRPDAVPPELYRQAYEDILTRTRAALPRCRLLLIDPFYLSTDRSPSSFRNVVLTLLPEYLRVVRDLSRAFGTRHIRTHEVFQRLLAHHEPDFFCAEPVHPNPTGHLVIAEAVYDALSRP